MSLFVDGFECQTAAASTPIAIVSRKILGRHPILDDQTGIFTGAIAEVLIYNRALGDDDLVQVFNYLRDRYKLTTP
jgi:hypothetical protein